LWPPPQRFRAPTDYASAVHRRQLAPSRIGNESADAIAGSLRPIFDFNESHQRRSALVVDAITRNA